MRKFINIITESEIDENCVDHDRIWKSTWTEWQDRDGIYLTLPGSNSIYVGFCSQREAEEYADTLDGDWRIVRHGRYRDLTDDEAKADPQIRHDRIMRGMWVDPVGDGA